MRKARWFRALLWSLALTVSVLSFAGLARSQDPYEVGGFSVDQLKQMLAPIALYPDDLLAQVLTAATYPLEVTQAAAWAQANTGLPGDQFAAALEQQDWDPSVKSLVNFPSVLQMMVDYLDWTQNLGDAFLGQQQMVMDTVWLLRRSAMERGSLSSTSQETVVEDPGSLDIAIEPASPDMFYVPVYDPTLVYGPVWGIGYPPFRYRPRGVIVGGFIGFRLGVAWGYAWGSFDWHRRCVTIDVRRHIQLNRFIRPEEYRSVARGSVWAHDPTHRRGFSYRNVALERKYGGRAAPSQVDARREFRGYGQGGALPASASPAVRSGGPPRPGATQPTPSAPPAFRPEGPPRSGGAPPAIAARSFPERPVQRADAGRPPVNFGGSAFGGSHTSSQIQEASSRGRESMRFAQAPSPPPRERVQPPPARPAPPPAAHAPPPPARQGGGSGGQGGGKKK